MRHCPRNARSGLFLSTSFVALVGCRAVTVCDPPGNTSGVFALAKNSDAYLSAAREGGGDVPHIACRAESTIEVQIVFIRSSEPLATGSSDRGPKGVDQGRLSQVASSDTPSYDPRIMVPRDDMRRFDGQYRVLGLGRGLDSDDCASAAMFACNEAIDAYFRKQNAVRPLGVPCRVADDRDRCPAFGGAQAHASTPAAPAVPERPEPPLATLVRKLDDDRTRPDAVRGVIQFFENAKKRANGDVSHADVRTLVDRVIEPMTRVYVDAPLDGTTRLALIRFLGEARDPRAGRAWIKAFASEDDVEWAALGIGATAYQEAAPALGEAFAKLEAGTPKGSLASKKVRAAMLALKSPGWKAMLLERIARPLQKPDDRSEAAKAAYENELFWQTTSVEVLGELRDASATLPLLKFSTDPAKGELWSAALLAIVGIGKDAVPFLLDVLAGKNAEFVALAKSMAADNGGNVKTHVAAAAWALGEMGRADARDGLVRASRSADHDENRAAIAYALTKLPPNADAKKAFQTAYEKLAPGASVPFSGRRFLLDAAASFYDSAMVPWLLKQVQSAKGADADGVREAGLRSALALMKAAQVPLVRPVAEKFGTDAVMQAFRASSVLLEPCDTAVDCYAEKLTDPASDAAAATKAAYMLGVLGDAKTATAIVERLARIETTSSRLAALKALDHLVQADGQAVADALETRAKETSLGDGGAMHRVALRLRAR